jgi:hypothetical protein
MLYACFIRVAYYCLLTTRSAVLIYVTFIGWIEGKMRQQGRVELQLMPTYTFSDFASVKIYLKSSRYLSKLELGFGLRKIISCNYKFLLAAIFPDKLINPGDRRIKYNPVITPLDSQSTGGKPGVSCTSLNELISFLGLINFATVEL